MLIEDQQLWKEEGRNIGQRKNDQPHFRPEHFVKSLIHLMSRLSDCPASNQNAEHLYDFSQSLDMSYPSDEISAAKAALKTLTTRGCVWTALSTLKQVLP